MPNALYVCCIHDNMHEGCTERQEAWFFFNILQGRIHHCLFQLSLRQVDSAETKEPGRSTNYVQYTHELKMLTCSKPHA
jgi:hypothetical protein